MIEAIKGLRGEELALCKCDDCAAEESVKAAHGHSAGQRRGGYAKLTLAKEGQVITKIEAKGWALVKNKLRCPKCEAKRKAQTPQEEPSMQKTENVTALRKPTPAQKRQIVELLMVSYDTDAGRYKGNDTDKTVAEAIGSGVMPGWVAEIREDMFGPAGGNDEMEALATEIREWQGQVSVEIETFRQEMAERVRKKQAEFQKRIEAIKAAVGPKAARA